MKNSKKVRENKQKKKSCTLIIPRFRFFLFVGFTRLVFLPFYFLLLRTTWLEFREFCKRTKKKKRRKFHPHTYMIPVVAAVRLLVYNFETKRNKCQFLVFSQDGRESRRALVRKNLKRIQPTTKFATKFARFSSCTSSFSIVKDNKKNIILDTQEDVKSSLFHASRWGLIFSKRIWDQISKIPHLHLTKRG